MVHWFVLGEATRIGRQVRRCGRRKRARVAAAASTIPQRQNQRRSHDRLLVGCVRRQHRFHILVVIVDFSRECPELKADTATQTFLRWELRLFEVNSGADLVSVIAGRSKRRPAASKRSRKSKYACPRMLGG